MASLSVALFHFCNILNPGVLLSISTYGKYGVQVFFVISGFIIPYSLHRGRYEIRYYLTFLLKRIVRLDPPYIVTIIIILALGGLSRILPIGNSGEFHVTPLQVLLHLGYLNTFFQYEWLSDVFWTLAIEFQYYLLIGLAYPLIFSRRLAVRMPALALLGATALVIPSQVYVFSFMYLFLMGVVICQFKVGMIGRYQCAILLIVLTVATYFANGTPTLIAGSIAAYAILFLTFRSAVFTFLGNISYSLYLLHSPIGRRAMNVAIRVLHPQSLTAEMAAVAVGVAASIAAAYILYRLVEKPAREWSAAFQYKHSRKRPKDISPEEIQQLNPAL